MLTVIPYAVQHSNDALLLLLRKDNALSTLAVKAAEETGFKPVDTLHVTLAYGNFPKSKRIFTMPNQIQLYEDIVCGAEEGKPTCYLDVAENSSSKLDSIVSALIGANNVCESHKYRVAIANH